MARILVYQVALQIVWWSCVLGGATGRPWLGLLVVVPWVAQHCWRQPLVRAELGLVAVAALWALLADALLIGVGGLRYTGTLPGVPLGPLWIVALWMAFATSVNVSFRWLRGRPVLAAMLGLAGGVPAYVAGRRLGVVDFALDDARAIGTLAAMWAVAIPLLVHIGRDFETRAAAESGRSEESPAGALVAGTNRIGLLSTRTRPSAP